MVLIDFVYEIDNRGDLSIIGVEFQDTNNNQKYDLVIVSMRNESPNPIILNEFLIEMNSNQSSIFHWEFSKLYIIGNEKIDTFRAKSKNINDELLGNKSINILIDYNFKDNPNDIQLIDFDLSVWLNPIYAVETGVELVGNTSIFIPFKRFYYSPIVLVTPILGKVEIRSGLEKAQFPVIQNITKDGFFILQSEDQRGYDNDGVIEGNVTYLILEKGKYNIGNLTLEADSILINGSYSWINFETEFKSIPVLFANTQERNINGPVRSRSGMITNHNFQLLVEYSNPKLNNNSIIVDSGFVGYLAIEKGHDTELKYQSGILNSSNTLNDIGIFDNISLSHLSYDNKPIIIVHLNSLFDRSQSYAVVRNVSVDQFQLAVEEINISDGYHESELIGWFSLPNKTYLTNNSTQIIIING